MKKSTDLYFLNNCSKSGPGFNKFIEICGAK